MPAGLFVENLQMTYGKVRALTDVSFEVGPGTCLGLLGPNGAGKTSLLHCLVGLQRPTRGVVELLDMDGNQLPIGQEVGFAPDDLPMPDLLTGNEYLELVSGLRGLRGGRSTFLEIAGVLRLDDAMDRLVGNYSHGMRRKLSLVAAIMHHPHVLVLDEPLRGLDPESSALTKRIIQTYVASGRVVILSTHDLLVAEQVCDRILVLDKGCMLGVGTVSELCSSAGRDTLEEAFLALTGIEKAAEHLAESLATALGRFQDDADT